MSKFVTNIGATLQDDGTFYHFGIVKDFAFIYGDDPNKIKQVCVEKSKDQKRYDLKAGEVETEVDYWGWWDFKKEIYTLIYEQRFLLDMCFPAGIDRTEKAGGGKAFRVNVTEIK